jgi:hypothetical protein
MSNKHTIAGNKCSDPECWCQPKGPILSDPEAKNINTTTGRLPSWGITNSDYSDNWWVATYDDRKTIAEIDMVNHPKHYQIDVNGKEIEVTELIETVLTKEEYVGYLKGNILKYHIRAHAKNGTEDIKKANFYSKILDRLV